MNKRTNKKITATILALLLIIGIGVPVYAMPTAQSAAIQDLIAEAQRISRAPEIAVSIVAGEDTHFYSTGVGEDVLFELASVSKQFTALGILYLEARGYLSLEDSVADHLPWLTFRYNGQPINMQDMRLYHLMHHTSGLPMIARPGAGTLLSGMETTVDAALSFYPGERMAYSNINYNLLGLVIETVSGQSYESFMEQHIFQPLGMMQTFAYRENAVATGQLIQGHGAQFVFFTRARNAPTSQITENIPTGYLISSSQDMTRWMQIQLGLVADIPEIFHTIVPRAHEPGRSVALGEGMPFPIYYAGGWLLNGETNSIEHGGNNPGFTTFIMLLPESQVGITVLANMCQVIDTGFIAHGIGDILGGDMDITYGISGIQIQDIVFTIITIAATLCAVLLIIRATQRIKGGNRRPITKKRIALVAMWGILTAVLVVATIAFPGLMGTGATWGLILSILSASVLTGMLGLILLFASITLFVSFPTK